MINFKLKQTAAVVFAAVIIFNTFAASAAVSIEELQNNIKQNAAKKQEITAKIETAQDELSEAVNKKKSLDVEMNTLNRDITMIDDAIKQKGSEIQQKTQEIEEINKSIEQNKKLLSERMKIMYEYSGFSYLDILLEADGLSDLFTRITIIRDIVRHDSALINQYTTAKSEIEASVAVIQKEQDEQQTAKNMLDEKKKNLSDIQAERENVISAIKGEINELELSSEQSEKYEEEARNELIRLMKEMEEAERTPSPTPAPTPTPVPATPKPGTSPTPTPKSTPTPTPKKNTDDNSGFGWPSGSHTVTSNYGYRIHPISGEKKLHSGMDIGVKEGTDVLASKAGTVVTAGWNNSYGYYVTINHGNGTATLYAHNSSLLVESGDKVSKGQVIAKSGSTGNSTGPHIHFEIIIDGKTVNPADYL